MSDEAHFLAAISANPADRLVRLVYADWLDEHDTPDRGEFVRVHTRLADLHPDHPDASLLRARERELRAGLQPYWVARLDPPVWCVAGNIVAERSPTPDRPEPRHGTRLFRPNAKVYLADNRNARLATVPTAPNWGRMQVLGQHRKSRDWVQCWVAAQLVTNWRIQLVHQPGLMIRLREAGWVGFYLRPDEFTWPIDRSTPDAVRALLDAADAAWRRTWDGNGPAAEGVRGSVTPLAGTAS